MEPEAKSCKLQNFYDAQNCTLAIICILIGAVVCFYGYRFFKFMLFLAGFLVAFVFTYLLCSAHLTNELSGNALKYKEQVFLGISIGAGLLAGLFTMCLYYVGLFLLGATMGWFVGMACLPVMYNHSEYMADHNWLPNLILTTFAVAMGILIICIQKVVIIISTSFLGAFLLVNGLDYYLENSKVLNYSLNILHGQYDQSFWPHCWYPWVMLCLIPVLFIAGMVVQSCKTGKGSDHRQAFTRTRSHFTMMGTQMQDFGDEQPIVTEYE